MTDATRHSPSFVDHQVASDYYFASATEAEAIAKGFTLKAYRGTSRACLFNASGTTWAATVPCVARSYAVDVHGFFEPVIAVLMIDPTGLPRLDASKLTDLQREQLQADEFGNPQAIGIYDRSDDHLLGGGVAVTAAHVPMEAVVLIDVMSIDARSSSAAPTATRSEVRFFEVLDLIREYYASPSTWFDVRLDDVTRQLASMGIVAIASTDGSRGYFLRDGFMVAPSGLTVAAEKQLVRRYRAIETLRSEAQAGSPPIFLSLEDGVHVCEGLQQGGGAEGASHHA